MWNNKCTSDVRFNIKDWLHDVGYKYSNIKNFLIITHKFRGFG